MESEEHFIGKIKKHELLDKCTQNHDNETF